MKIAHFKNGVTTVADATPEEENRMRSIEPMQETVTATLDDVIEALNVLEEIVLGGTDND